MTRSHRIIAASLIGLLLLTGFAIGRFSHSSSTNAAEAPALAAVANPQPQPQPVADTANTTNNDQFYLSDFKTGYNDGYQAGLNKQTGVATVDTSRQGYNEGYKEGYTDGYQGLQNETTGAAPTVATRERVVYRSGGTRTVYRSSGHRGGSKLRTALTIAAPAAVGAGIGALFGGKKGAGIGALLGGGGGAFYALSRRNRR